MSDTIAMPSEVLATANHDVTGQPLCPACVGGYLHPYKVQISCPVPYGWGEADYLEGFVAVCHGNVDYKRAYAEKFPDVDLSELDDVPPCGFSMPLAPHKRPNPA